MRVLRLLLVGTVILALLGGTGTMAQSEEVPPDEATGAWVEGTARLTTPIDFGEMTEVDEERGLYQVRGAAYEGVIESNDPRVAGTGSATLNYDSHPLGADFYHPLTNWGTMDFENDGGAWECTWSGGEMALGASEVVNWCVGRDGYDGWAMQMLMTFTDVAGVNDFVGFLWPGELPPLPAPPSSE